MYKVYVYPKTPNQEKYYISVQEVFKNIQNNIGHTSKYLDPNKAHQQENVQSYHKLSIEIIW